MHRVIIYRRICRKGHTNKIIFHGQLRENTEETVEIVERILKVFFSDVKRGDDTDCIPGAYF